MDFKINEIDGATREIHIDIPKNLYQEELEIAFRNAQSNISLKGFRKGKVPIKLIKQYYGKEIESELINNLANKFFADIVEKNNIDFIGKAILTKYEILDDKVLLVISYEVIPEVELKDYKGIQIYEPIHRVTDDEIEKEIRNRLLQFAIPKKVDKIENENTIIEIEITELEKDTGLEIKNSKPKKFSINLLDYELPETLKVQFLGKTIGDEFIYQENTSDSQATKVINKIKILDIKELEPPQLDDEFVREYTFGRLSTVEELRREIGYQLQERWDIQSNKEMAKQIINELIEMHKFDLPKRFVMETSIKLYESFIKKYKDSSTSKLQLNEEILKEFIPTAESRVKWLVLKHNIVKKENIKIEDYDLDQIISQYQLNTNSTNEEEIKKKILNNANLLENLLEKKVIDLLTSFAETSEIDFEEYIKISSKNEQQILTDRHNNFADTGMPEKEIKKVGYDETVD
ncbi:MAG: trigger factor [Ignavibacteria bacterium]|nr:trigger factor [Ignavibacteria bacterium]